MDRLELTRLRPDIAEWVDLRGFLLSERCDVHANFDPATGFVVRSWDFPVAVAAGEPAVDVIAEAIAGAGSQDDEWHLLAAGESLAAVEEALRGWVRRGVTAPTSPVRKRRWCRRYSIRHPSRSPGTR